MSTTLDQLIEKEAERKSYREEYNKRPGVKGRRTLYNKKRNGEMGVAKNFTDGKITKEEAEEQLLELDRIHKAGVADLG